MIRIVKAYNFCIFAPLIKPKVVNMKASLKKMLMSLFFVGAAFTAFWWFDMGFGISISFQPEKLFGRNGRSLYV